MLISRRKVGLLLLSLISLVVAMRCAAAQESQPLSQANDKERLNRVEILSPCNGDQVGFRTVVRGTSQISDDSGIWVLAHVEFFGDLWWPQLKPKVEKNGDWEALVYLGMPQDIGFVFEIAVAAFDKQEERKILEYHQRGMRTGSWPPIRFPKTTSNIDIIRVKKTSHYE